MKVGSRIRNLSVASPKP